MEDPILDALRARYGHLNPFVQFQSTGRGILQSITYTGPKLALIEVGLANEDHFSELPNEKSAYVYFETCETGDRFSLSRRADGLFQIYVQTWEEHYERRNFSTKQAARLIRGIFA